MEAEQTDKSGGMTLRQIALRSYRQNKTGYVLLWALLCCGAIFCAVQMCRISCSGIDPAQRISYGWDSFAGTDASSNYADIDAVVAAARESNYPIHVFRDDTLLTANGIVIMALAVAVAVLSFRVKNVFFGDKLRLFVCSALCHMTLLAGVLFWYDSMTFAVDESYILYCGETIWMIGFVIAIISFFVFVPALLLIYAIYRILRKLKKIWKL